MKGKRKQHKVLLLCETAQTQQVIQAEEEGKRCACAVVVGGMGVDEVEGV